MLYNEMLILAFQHKQEIAYHALELLQIKLNRPDALITSKMEQLNQATLEVQLRFLQNRNVIELKAHITYVMRHQEQYGLNYFEIMWAGDALDEALSAFFVREAELQANQETDQTLQRLKRRMRGLTMVANSTSMTFGIEQANQESS